MAKFLVSLTYNFWTPLLSISNRRTHCKTDQEGDRQTELIEIFFCQQMAIGIFILGEQECEPQHPVLPRKPSVYIFLRHGIDNVDNKISRKHLITCNLLYIMTLLYQSRLHVSAQLEKRSLTSYMFTSKQSSL